MSVHLAHDHVAKTPQQGVPDDPLLDAAVAALVKNPAASLSEVAVAAGVGVWFWAWFWAVGAGGGAGCSRW